MLFRVNKMLLEDTGILRQPAQAKRLLCYCDFVNPTSVITRRVPRAYLGRISSDTSLFRPRESSDANDTHSVVDANAVVAIASNTRPVEH